MIQGQKILTTGGAGFIGTHMAERLAAHNEVTLLDIDLAGPLRYSPLAKDDRVRKVHGDVRIYDQVAPEVARCDILLHYASILGVKRNWEQTIDDPADVIASSGVNVAGINFGNKNTRG
jgi:UDP-glucose 4-epimerase